MNERRKRYLRIAARLFLAVGVVVAVLLVALAWLFASPSGRDRLLRSAESFVARHAEVSVRFGAVSGRFPFDFALDRLTIGDADGDWLEARGLRLAWSPKGLLQGRYHIRHATADHVRLDRLPRSPESAAPAPIRLPPLPASLPAFSIDRLVVQRLELALADTDATPVVRVEGRVTSGEGGADTRARVDVTALEGVPVEGSADVTLDTEAATLAVDVRYRETAPVLLGAYLGAPVNARLAGAGPLTEWRGELQVDAAETTLAQLALRLGAEETVSLAAEGTLRAPVRLLPERLRAILADDALLALDIAVPARDGLRLDRLSLEIPGARLQVAGSLDDAVDLRATLAVDDLARWETVAGHALTGRATVEAHVTGPLDRPGADVMLRAERIETPLGALDSIDARLDVRPAAPIRDRFPGVSLNGHGVFRGLDASFEAGALLDEAKWSLDASADERGRIAVRALDLETGEGRLSAEGRYDPETGDAGLRVRGDLPALEPFSALANLSLAGGLCFTAEAAGNAPRGDFLFVVEGDVSGLSGLPARLDGPVGPSPHVAASGRLTGARRLDLDTFTARFAAGETTATGWLDPADSRFEMSWEALIERLDLFSELVRRDVQGAASASGNASGTFADARFDLTAATRRLQVAGLAVEALTLTFDGGRDAESLRGDARVSVRSEGESLEMSSVFAHYGERASLTSLRLTAPGLRLDGGLDYSLSAGTLDGAVDVDAADLAWLGRLSGTGLEGRAQGKMTLSARGPAQDAALDLSANAIRLAGADLEQLSVQASARDLLRVFEGEAQVRASNLRRDGQVLSTARLDARGALDAGTFSFETSGDVRGPAAARGDGAWTRTGREGFEIRLASLNADWAGVPLALDGSLTARAAGDALQVDPFRFSLAGGTLRGALAYAPDRIEAALDLERLPLASLNGGGEAADLDGEANVVLRLNGNPAAPDLDVNALLANVRIGKRLPATELRADARYRGDRFRGDFTVTGLFDEPITGNFDLPLQLAAAPFALALPADQPVSASLRLVGDLDTLADIAMLDGHVLSGGLNAAIDVAGTLADPRTQGTVRIDDASYESFAMGAALRNIDVLLEGVGPRFEVRHAEATDTGQGALKASGWVVLHPGEHFPFDMQIELASARLINRDDITASLSGAVRAAGSWQAIRLSGDVSVAPAEIRIPEPPPQMMAGLQVVETDSRIERPYPPPPVTPSAVLERASLALNVNSPGRVFVRGPGMDSEWGGAMRIVGPALDPEVTGGLELIRGSVDLLGRSFVLTDGSVTLDGAFPPQPVIDLRAQSRTNGFDAVIVLRGHTNALDLELTSNPPLPRDEILARLLFGKSVSSISPMQAVQLAQTAAALSQGFGSPTLMDRTRRALGFDQLDVVQSDDDFRDTTVGAGKYLTDDIYVWLEHGIGQETGKVRLEVEITDSLSVESSAGQDGKGNIGLNWKRDY